jgi:glyoxylase-like metal-dependent hydrolase (beta-lactamase superfamily II)
MQLNDDVHVLVLPMVRDGQTFPLNLSLIVDQANGATLVDAGLPGQDGAIAAALSETGVGVQDLKRIVLTHQDVDHVGSLHTLRETSGARVLAHEVEAPFIDGTRVPRFARPEVLAQRPQFRALVESIRPTPVDERLQDGATLDLAGGVRVVFTPGHTPGHMCLLLERTGTLIAGDALTASEGRLQGPNPDATMDMPAAARSVRALAAFDVKAIVCYHGGVVNENASDQLRRVADELEANQPG